MIEVIVISAAANRIVAMDVPQSYESFAAAIGTERFDIRILDGGDSIFFPEDITDGTGTFEMDHCVFNAPAIIFRQGEFSIPETPRMTVFDARRRISHLQAGWDEYERVQT